MRRLLGTVGFAIAAVLGIGGPVVAQPGPAPPIHTSKTRFRIPYRFDPAELQRIGAREVRLFVSTDRGRNWTVGGSAAPDARRFDYQAKGDGEYWFAVRTVDGGGRLHPAGPITTPALKVVVDTKPPELKVALSQPKPGRIELAWQANDANLDPTQLRLEYVQPGETKWQQVGVVPKPSGRTAWSAPGAGSVAVRALISDLAGNVGRAQARIEAGRAGAASPSPDLRQPIAEGDSPSDPAVALLPNDPSVSAMKPIEPLRPRDTLVSDDPSRRPDVLGSRYPTEDPDRIESPTESWSVGNPHRPRVVNSRSFEVDYKVEDVGPSGLSSVEFYITTDDGAKWWRYGKDEDLASPFKVNVPRDGVYGFSLRARSGVGLAADPPQPGEKPAIVVAVDRTVPQVDLLPVQQGTGRALNQINIRWRIEDANPSDKPIALSYAEDRLGPWEPITGWTADRGSYLWTVGPGVPARFFVRLTVRDAAGNVTRVETEEPVLVDLKKPSARIVDVQSVDNPDGTRPR